jgi:flagellum-specific peptidoglycan hydrolase FlgJ
MKLTPYWIRSKTFVATHRYWFIAGVILLLFLWTTDFSFDIRLKSKLNTSDDEEDAISLMSGNFGSKPHAESVASEPDEINRAALVVPEAVQVATKSKMQTNPNLSDNDAEQVKQFVKRFAKVAHAEQKRFGIPASITLGMAILQSKSGNHPSVESSNNFFLLPTGNDWPGESVAYKGKTLRKYNNAWSSFRDHSHILNDWIMKKAGAVPKTKYQTWFDKLLSTDYINKEQGKQLADIVSSFNLTEIDELPLD